MRIVMAGASGFLGRHLRQRLTDDGHDVVQLVRSTPTEASQRGWHPDRGELDPAVVAGADAVINLAGAGVQDKRWNDTYRQVLISSRVGPTDTIAKTLAVLPAGERPEVLLNASATGFYGDTGDTAVDENSAPGQGFFPELCQLWEAATDPAAKAGVRVAKLRTGLILDRGGGLLKPFMLPFSVGIGGPLAGGRQWMPWMSLEDWLAAVIFLLERGEIAGPVNLVGPDPVRNSEFTKALGRVLHRPAIAPIPKVALQVLLGDFAHEALFSQRVLPAVLNRTGFAFTHPDLDSALRSAVHRGPARMAQH
jgi:uncharacterized protein (TIGR01777 family)